MKTKAILDFAKQKWWMIYSVSIALFVLWAVIAVYGPATPKPDDEIVFYPWITLKDKADIFAVIAFGGAIVGCILYGLQKNLLQYHLF